MANEEDSQEDEKSHLREEFRQLIIPLMHKSLHDKPTDVTAYCARYFQNLLEARQRKSISRNEHENTQQNNNIGIGQKAARRESITLVQESTSQPILTDVHHGRLSLRETSSWSSPSDSPSTPRLLWDVADAMSNIGDQPKSNKTSKDARDSENANLREPGSQLSFGDEGSEVEKEDLEKPERNGDSSPLRRNKSSTPDNNIAVSFNHETEEELRSIAHLASSSTDASSRAAYRKKWSTNDMNSLLELKSEANDCEENYSMCVNRSNNDEEEIAAKGNCSNDDIVESSKFSWESTSPNTSFGSIPQLKDLAILASAKRTSTPFIQKEIENSVKSVRRSLQELIKVLDSMKTFCYENLQKVKTLGEVLPARSQPAPRKKRSVTTFSSSDNLFQSKESVFGSKNKLGSSGAGKVCSKMTQKYFEEKNNSREDELDSLGYDNRKKIEEEFTQSKNHVLVEENIASMTTCSNSKRGSSLDENVERNRKNIKEVKIVDPKDISMKDRPRWKDGVVNKGFVMDDGELHRKIPSHGQQQYYGQNSWHGNGYRRRNLIDSNAFSQIRISRPCPGRNSNITRQHNLENRQMLRFRVASGVPSVGEGGDVFAARQRQCSVATETDFTQTTEGAENLNESNRTLRIQPVIDGNTEPEPSTSNNTGGKIRNETSGKERCNSMPPLSEEPSSKVSQEKPVQGGPSSEKTPETMSENKEAEQIKFDTKPTKKSSSLNPCAECFNPTTKIIQNLEASKSLSGNETKNSAPKSFDSFTEIPARQPTIPFPELDAEAMWDYELFEDDLLLQEPILYQNGDSDGDTISLTLEEIEDQHNFENEVCESECNLLNTVPYSYPENGFLRGHHESDSEKNSEGTKSKKRQSEMKLAEGDQGSDGEEEPADRSHSAEKQEEPGLNSACGDFVASENGNEVDGNSVDDSRNIQPVVVSDAIDLGNGISGLLPSNSENISSQYRRLEQNEEMELNFACFSGSDSSEVDSSDISEEENEFSEENDETKLEEKT